MQHLINCIVQFQLIIQWLDDTLVYLGFYPKPIQPEYLPEAIQTESTLPVAIHPESLPNAIQTECSPEPSQTADMSQQTDDIPKTQKPSVREEQLTKQVSDLERQLKETLDVSEERNKKAHKLERDLGVMESHYKLEIANITRRRSEEIIANEIEVMHIQDECDIRIADMELSNAKLMERIVELETEQSSQPNNVLSCRKQSGNSDESLARVESIQEHLSSLDVVTEHSKWTVNYVLEQIKNDITSGTSDDPQVDEEKEKLIKESQTIKFEMETVKLALADAMKTIAEMEQRHSLMISFESQMKTIVDAKDSLLASKDAELEHLRASAEQAKCKPKIATRDVGCGTEDIQLPVVQRKDVGCNTEDLPSLPLAKGKDVGCNTDDLPSLPPIKVTKSASTRTEKPSAGEREQRPKRRELFSQKVKQSQQGKVEAEAVKQPEAKPEKKIEKDKSPAEKESILGNVMEVLFPSKSPAPVAQTPASSPPTVEVKSPAAEIKYPSGDIRYKNKPMEGYSHNLLDGTTSIYPEPRKEAAPIEPAAGLVMISKEVKQTERPDRLILSDIHQTHYGRIVGRGGENVKRMQLSHGVAMSLVVSTTDKEFHNMIIKGGNPEKRQDAAREIIESLPVTIECPANVNLKKLYNPEVKKLFNSLFVKINRATKPNEKTTMFGRINDCRKAYDLLVNDTRPPAPPK